MNVVLCIFVREQVHSDFQSVPSMSTRGEVSFTPPIQWFHNNYGRFKSQLYEAYGRKEERYMKKKGEAKGCDGEMELREEALCSISPTLK